MPEFGGVQGMVDDVEIGSEKNLIGFAVQVSQKDTLLLECDFLNESCEKVLDPVQVSHVEEVQLLGWRPKNARDCIIIKQKVNAVHALDQEVFYLVQMGFADSQIVHTLMFWLNPCPGKGKRPRFDYQDFGRYPEISPDDGLPQFETDETMYTMTMARVSKKREIDPIVIDEEHGLVFASEEELYSHFENEIGTLEKEFFSVRKGDDIREHEFKKFDRHLQDLLDDPDEVWEDSDTFGGDRPTYVYVRKFDRDVFHVAVCYLTKNTPSFVYLHFPSRDPDLVQTYRRGQLVFQRSHEDAPVGAVEGDALYEGDDLALGLYRAMLLLRGASDIPETDFRLYGDCREQTLEDADEIWRSGDSLGNVLVSFIREFPEDDEFYYIVVTVEDAPSGSHALLFSFPTRDRSLVDRYRHGENLQAEEVVQESSH